jgi:hypothetical protein
MYEYRRGKAGVVKVARTVAARVKTSSIRTCGTDLSE